MSMFIKNSDGKPSASLTFCTITFIIVNLWFLLSIFESLGPVKVKPFDFMGATLFMSPLFSLYWGRRWTDAKTSNNTLPEADDNENPRQD